MPGWRFPIVGRHAVPLLFVDALWAVGGRRTGRRIIALARVTWTSDRLVMISALAAVAPADASYDSRKFCIAGP